MKSVSQAMKYESGRVFKPSKRVKRSWAVKDTEKHLERLSTPRIVLYVYKRHEAIILSVALAATWTLAILGKI